MNVSYDLSNDGYRQCYSALSRYNVFNCDEFIDDGVGTCVTYCNQGLQQSSFLDHVFVSNSIRHHINGAEVHDTGVNLSDHIPIIYSFNWSITLQACQTNRPKKIKLYSWRWDKSGLNYYYQCTDQELHAISIPLFCDSRDLNCKLSCHLTCTMKTLWLHYILLRVLLYGRYHAIHWNHSRMRNWTGWNKTQSFGTICGSMLVGPLLGFCSILGYHVRPSTS